MVSVRHAPEPGTIAAQLDDGSALLAAAQPDPTPKKRMPAIMDLHLLPDMGRMTGRLRSAAIMRTT